MTREFTACILEPRGPFHVGEREGMREGSEVFIHSDTLFSALCHSLLLLLGREELERLMREQGAESREQLPVLLSSAFPFWKDEFYFPVPRNQIPPNKDAKQVRFLLLAVLEKALAGPLPEDAWLSGIPSPCRAEGKGEEWPAPWRTDDVPKVALSRLSGTADEGGFYHIGLTFYEDDAALFFLVQFGSDDWRKKLEAAIRLMCDEGIGGYRTIGRGQFEQPTFKDIRLDLPETASGQSLLSLYYPAKDEEPGLADGWYELVPRKGYVFSPENRSLRRRSVTMFAEGSVFPRPESREQRAESRATSDGDGRKGRLVDVTPDNAGDLGLSHRVYRNGLAFCVPCRLSPSSCHPEPTSACHSELPSACHSERSEESVPAGDGGTHV